MASAARSRVFSGYRRLFRARKALFTGDDLAMKESRVAIKAEFVKNRDVVTEGPHFEGLLTMVDEAEHMLRVGIVRGDLNEETGHYRECRGDFVTPCAAEWMLWAHNFPFRNHTQR